GRPIKVEVPVEFPAGMNRKTTLGEDDEAIRVDTSQATVNVTSSSISSLPVNGRSYKALRKLSSKGKGRQTVSSNGSGSGGSGSGIGYGSGSGSGSGRGIAPPPPPKSISGGIINGKATSLPKPPYPAAARAVRASGAVNVQVTIDESGNVVSVSAVSGHPLLRAAAEQAARKAGFAPTLLSGQPVKVTGVVVYNFTDPEYLGNINVSVSEMRLQTDEEKSQTPIMLEVLKQQVLAQKLHVWIYALVERRQKGVTAPTSNETKFVKDGKAIVQIRFSVKTPETIEKLKALGFEVVSEKDKDTIFGRIGIEKIVNLAEMAEVQYILPKLD
ncbi:MAG: energy transducer TonB, partial [Acidobacteriota bacterium]|nr:energy transducer TonB [Acidobacteriota bacterium]